MDPLSMGISIFRARGFIIMSEKRINFLFMQKDYVLHLFAETKTLIPEKVKPAISQLMLQPEWKGLCWLSQS